MFHSPLLDGVLLAGLEPAYALNERVQKIWGNVLHPAGTSVISSYISNFCSNFSMGIYANFFYLGKYILKHK